MFMVFNTSFNHILTISWQSVLLVEVCQHEEAVLFLICTQLSDTYFLTLSGRLGRDRIVVGFTTTYAMSITTNVVSSIQHYVIKFVSDLQQDAGFLQALRFPPPIKLTAFCEKDSSGKKNL
jgi:hypothetical protein